MNTQQAYNDSQALIQNQNEFYTTVLWVLFTVFVIAPIVMLLIYIPVAIAKQPKCPDCGSRKLKSELKKVKKGDTESLEEVTVCRSCQKES